MNRKVISAGVLALALAGCGGVQNESSSSSTNQPTKQTATSQAAPKAKAKAPMSHVEDVQITQCSADPATNWMAAKIKVTNHSSKTSNYMVEVSFVSPDGKTQYGSAMTAVNNLDAGQVALETAQSLDEAKGKFICKVADVTRYAS